MFCVWSAPMSSQIAMPLQLYEFVVNALVGVAADDVEKVAALLSAAKVTDLRTLLAVGDAEGWCVGARVRCRAAKAFRVQAQLLPSAASVHRMLLARAVEVARQQPGVTQRAGSSEAVRCAGCYTTVDMSAARLCVSQSPVG